jgi:hypothetical protein
MQAPPPAMFQAFYMMTVLLSDFLLSPALSFSPFVGGWRDGQGAHGSDVCWHTTQTGPKLVHLWSECRGTVQKGLSLSLGAAKLGNEAAIHVFLQWRGPIYG